METAIKFEYPENFIKYLGTSGGRFSMIRQLRSTGGLWFRYGGVQGVIDPGPGSLAHICAARPALEVASADVVMLTHKHIDHSTRAAYSSRRTTPCAALIPSCSSTRRKGYQK